MVGIKAIKIIIIIKKLHNQLLSNTVNRNIKKITSNKKIIAIFIYQYFLFTKWEKERF
jgi:hypothetical protein